MSIFVGAFSFIYFFSLKRGNISVFRSLEKWIRPNFVQALQNWTENPSICHLDVAKAIKEAQDNWATITEEWALLDEQQRANDKSDLLNAEIHYHLLMAKLYSVLEPTDVDKSVKVVCQTPIVEVNTWAVVSVSNVSPTKRVVFGNPSAKLVAEILEPFFCRTTMKNAYKQHLVKLHEMLKSALSKVNEFSLDEDVFEAILLYGSVRLLDDVTKVVFHMMDHDEQSKLVSVMKMIKRRAELLQEPMDMESNYQSSTFPQITQANISTGTNPKTSSASGSSIQPMEQMQMVNPHRFEYESQETNWRPFCYYCKQMH